MRRAEGLAVNSGKALCTGISRQVDSRKGYGICGAAVHSRLQPRQRLASSTRSSASSAVDPTRTNGPSFGLHAACASRTSAGAPGHGERCGEVGVGAASQTSPSRFTIAHGRDQRCIAERQIASSANQLLKLAGDASALALVIAVVRARGEFVDEQLTLFRHEHLHAKQALDAELRDDAARPVLRRATQAPAGMPAGSTLQARI